MSEIKKSLLGTVVSWITERNARNLSYDDLRSRMVASGEKVGQRFEQVAADTPANREAINHITGIERWGSRRIRVALGELLIIDEYDGYAPGSGLSKAALCETFRSTRADTLKLIDALQTAKVPLTQTVPHNELGNMSVRTWLLYLHDHCVREGTYRVR